MTTARYSKRCKQWIICEKDMIEEDASESTNVHRT